MVDQQTTKSKIFSGISSLTLLTTVCLASCGGGGSSGIASAAAVSNGNVSLVAPRTSGVAPLAVFFDATGTTGTATAVPQPFHNLQYTWDFGDTAGSPVNGKTWSLGSQSAAATCSSPPYNGCRNNATGAVAAHVFENPGTFTVTLTVSDGVHPPVQTKQNITVTAFSGAAYCIYSSTPLNSGICNGVEHLASADIHNDVITALSNGAKQILFKRGDIFTTTTSANITSAGPGIIGSYGSGAIPVITTSSTTAYNSIFAFKTADWRLMDIDLEGGGGTLQYGAYSYNQTTYLRVTTGKLYYAFNGSGGNDIAIQDSTINPTTDPGAYGFYCGGCLRSMLMGNSMHLGTISGGHDIRLQGVNYFVITNSNQQGSGAVGSFNGFTIRGDSQYGEISDNNLIGYDSQIQPQNSTSNEYQHDIVVERNFFTASQLVLAGSYVTVRNNIFNMTGYVKTNPEHAIDVIWNSTISPVPVGNNIFNNTIYTADVSGAGAYSAAIGIGATLAGKNCTLATGNNLTYIPNGTTSVYLLDSSSGGCAITGTQGTNGNSSDVQVKGTSPNWLNASTTYSLPSDFKPSSSSYAVSGNAGYAGPYVPTLLTQTDFVGAIRSGKYDMGAVNH